MAHRAYVGLLALVVVLAGCAGTPVNPTDTAATTDEPAGTDDPASMDGSQVNFYISDEQNAIGDFEHLNVTITKVGFHRGGESGSWIERDVDDETVDLTELQGENASLVDEFDLPNGTYTKVFIYVNETDGTLKSGDDTNVKLPSGKIQLNKQFAVGDGEVDFVFDVTVVKAGKSGKYILKPVVGESGTDVPIEKVDEEDEAESEDEDDDERDESESDALSVTFVGNVTRGGNATVQVTRDGDPVENATVLVNGEEAGATDADGEFSFPVEEDATELTVEVVDGDSEAELEVEFEDSETESDEEANGSAAETETPTATATP